MTTLKFKAIKRSTKRPSTADLVFSLQGAADAMEELTQLPESRMGNLALNIKLQVDELCRRIEGDSVADFDPDD